ncbi:Uncharacterised protein [Bordetella pertussis]|nr:Uncharacterised protein [Bordetella pertussis]CRE31955.1 Uncharacterised protein [Bordetella pertussis]
MAIEARKTAMPRPALAMPASSQRPAVARWGCKGLSTSCRLVIACSQISCRRTPISGSSITKSGGAGMRTIRPVE